ncbi:MAG: TIGR02186 family protein [Pseudomonadota bacterium]
MLLRCNVARQLLGVMGAIVLALAAVAFSAENATAQDETPAVKPAAPATSPPTARAPTGKEVVLADIATRRVAVTSTFDGSQILIFGTIDQRVIDRPTRDAYDIVIVVKGVPETLTARRKARVAGIWLNVASQTFKDVPSYYAIVSTRGLADISEPDVLSELQIGFKNVPLKLADAKGEALPKDELAAFRAAVVRLKRSEKLFQSKPQGVMFTGDNLFRATIDLPANVTVGRFETTVYLFRDGKLRSTYQAGINLEREGLEKYLHGFAFDYPFWYGIAAVILAVAAGLLASQVFGRPGK